MAIEPHDERKPGRSALPGTITPLWIVGAFLGLSETAMTVGAIQTEGSIQWLMTIFAVLYPLLVTGGFFYILWHRNWVLFPPREFDKVGPEVFVEAMQRRVVPRTDPTQVIDTIESAIKKAFSSVEVSETVAKAIPSTVESEDREQIIEELTHSFDLALVKAVEEIRQRSTLTLNVKEGPRSGTHRIPYDGEMRVDDFITYLAQDFLLSDEDRNSTGKRLQMYLNYGLSWTLAQPYRDEPADVLGMPWAQKNIEGTYDTRRLANTKIKPGMYLELRRLRAEDVPTQNILPVPAGYADLD